ncbi:MAG: soluble lytic murein transglycosylase [Glaciecola sp.]|jgi:soluble lytic murein transglycosylase
MKAKSALAVKNLILISSVFFSILSFSSFSVAQTNNTDALFAMPDRADQRAAFLRAERRVWQMDNAELAELVKELAGYPLIPYLIERKLSDRIQLSDKEQIRAFLEIYKGGPLARKLRRNWLEYLEKRQRASLFVEFYRPTSSAKLACAFLDFQIELGGDITESYSKIAALWTVGNSQPKQCDDLFKKWINAGQLTEDLVLLRIKKAADGGRHTLIPYLRTLLPKEKQYLADLWHKTRRDPSHVKNAKNFLGKYPLIEAEIMSYGLSRLIWRDQALAMRTMEKAEKHMIFTQVQRARVYGRFGIKLAMDNHEAAEEWLLKAADADDDPEVMRWHLAYLLRQQDWARIILLIENAAPQKVAAKDYSYWLARSYEQLGRQDEANVLYKQVATHRHYYGFLASARIDQPYQLENSPVVVSDESILKTMSLSSSHRAYELRQLNRHHEARLEWRHTQGQLGEDEKLVTSVISSAWEWHDQAIFTFSREGYLDDVNRRFPTAFENIIVREATKNNIEPEWAFAIARRESSFMPDAVSPANARGLMQLLPSTAKYLENRRISSRKLLDAEINAKLGNKYLRYLMNKLDNNRILATASYNAGWRKVRQWLPENEALASDIWVELIPYRETRNYVKAVTAYKQIYNAKLNDEVTLSPDVASAKATVFEQFIETAIPVSL